MNVKRRINVQLNVLNVHVERHNKRQYQSFCEDSLQARTSNMTTPEFMEKWQRTLKERENLREALQRRTTADGQYLASILVQEQMILAMVMAKAEWLDEVDGQLTETQEKFDKEAQTFFQEQARRTRELRTREQQVRQRESEIQREEQKLIGWTQALEAREHQEYL